MKTLGEVFYHLLNVHIYGGKPVGNLLVTTFRRIAIFSISFLNNTRYLKFFPILRKQTLPRINVAVVVSIHYEYENHCLAGVQQTLSSCGQMQKAGPMP